MPLAIESLVDYEGKVCFAKPRSASNRPSKKSSYLGTLLGEARANMNDVRLAVFLQRTLESAHYYLATRRIWPRRDPAIF